MTRLRLVREPARTCNGCGVRGPVLRLELGDTIARACQICFERLIVGRSQLVTWGLDSWEPR